jgi:hypothetical protein
MTHKCAEASHQRVAGTDLSFEPKDLSFSPKDLSFSPKDLSFGPKLFSFSPKDLSFRPKLFSFGLKVLSFAARGPPALRSPLQSARKCLKEKEISPCLN